MVIFDVMIDDLGRIELPETVKDMLNTNHSGDSLSITVDLDEKGKPHVALTTSFMKPEMPKEEKIYTFYNSYTYDIYRTVKITKEQNKFLDWLIDQGYILDTIEINPGYPDVEDLTE